MSARVVKDGAASLSMHGKIFMAEHLDLRNKELWFIGLKRGACSGLESLIRKRRYPCGREGSVVSALQSARVF